jgi:ribosomal-protein-alanine N-acetyltransferase
MDGIEVTVRPATPDDLTAIADIQAASPEAAQWHPSDYLDHDCSVAVRQDCIAGFLVARQVAPGEREILNLAVKPLERRHGIARALVAHELARATGAWYLEVRSSNHPAIQLYESAGFKPSGRRTAYYDEPAEDGIVMRFFS